MANEHSITCERILLVKFPEKSFSTATPCLHQLRSDYREPLRWAPQRTPLMVALQILCMAGIDFRTMIAHNPQPAGQVSLPKHLGNVDYSKATCNPAYNAAEDRQTWQARPTTSHSCPQPRKSTLYSR